MNKAVPVASESNAPYWAAAREHKLVLQQCIPCGCYNAQPRLICPRCHAEDFTWSSVSGRGAIHSYTIVWQTTSPGFEDEVPYVIVNVAIEEQPQCIVTANLIGDVDFDRLTIELPVVVDFEERGDTTLPQFRLA